MYYTEKMKMIAVIIAVAVIAIAGVSIFVLAGNPKWEAFDKNEQYQGFFDSPIIEMELQKSIDTKVCFTDKEFIDQWKAFFNTLEIKREHCESVFDENFIGGGRYIRVRTERSNYNFSFTAYTTDKDGISIKIGKTYYTFRSEEDFDELFDQVYDIAKKRYKEINLWEQ